MFRQTIRYIAVAIITATVVDLIYPFTVRQTSVPLENELHVSSPDILASQELGWPYFGYGTGDLIEENKSFILPDGMNSLFVVTGCSDWYHNQQDLDSNGFVSFVWASVCSVTSDSCVWLMDLVNSNPCVQYLKSGYFEPLLEKITSIIYPVDKFDLQSAMADDWNFSLMSGYDYGPCSFFPAPYSKTQDIDDQWLKQYLNWLPLGQPSEEHGSVYLVGQASLHLLTALFLPLATFVCIINAIFLFCVNTFDFRPYNYKGSSRVPSIRVKDKDGRTTTLRFKTKRVLAYGSFGKVQEVSQLGSSKTYVVKTVKKVETTSLDIKETKSVAALEAIGFLDRIYLEKRVLTVARDCPFLTHLMWAVEDDIYMHFFTPIHTGGDITNLLRKYYHLAEDVVRFIAIEVICGLQFLHSHGIVHRDLKLENIVVDSDGHIRLIDFGLAAENVFDSQKKLYDHCGSPLTMAPEILNDDAYNESCDWWALGAVMFWMYTGEPPFYGSSIDEICYRITNEDPSWEESADYDIKDCILWFLEKDPDFRLGMKGCPAGRIEDQAFFKDVDWEKANVKELSPPCLLGMAPVLINIDEKQKIKAEKRSKAMRKWWHDQFNRVHLSTLKEF